MRDGSGSAVDRTTSEHYVWGDVCDGWRLLDGPDLSVIEERVPAGASEIWHTHTRARQFFYVLKGTATLVFADDVVLLRAGQGLEVPPGRPHRFENRSDDEVVFLVISTPTTRGDRVDLER